MKKAMVTFTTLLLCVCVSYGWFKANFTGSLKMVATHAQVSSGNVLVKVGGEAKANATLPASVELGFVTSDDGLSFKDENGQAVSAGYYATNYTIKGDAELSHLTVEVDFGDDTLSPALRVMISINGKSHIYKVGDDFTFDFGAINTFSNPVTMSVWYEGTDSSCTLANAVQSSTTNNIVISFEGEQ